MIISIASGKGGTGKTTAALNLALVAAGSGTAVQLLDCDVEEPNCHLFLHPELGPEEAVFVPVPELDEAACTGCGECGRICQFGAIACLAGTVITFPEMCHGCGGCILACPEKALTEGKRLVGWRQAGKAIGLTCGAEVGFAQGRLRVGEAMAAPLIHEVKRLLRPETLNIIDAPPGTSCPVIAAVAGSDYVVLVTEPTPFGLNDLELAVGMVRALGLPFGVVINRFDVGDGRTESFCRQENIEVLSRLPHDTELARTYSRGEVAVGRLAGYQERFSQMLAAIGQAAARREAGQ